MLERDKGHKDEISKNSKAYIDKLTELKNSSQEKFNDIPKAERNMITSEGHSNTSHNNMT